MGWVDKQEVDTKISGEQVVYNAEITAQEANDIANKLKNEY
jgi:hypothetical protein